MAWPFNFKSTPKKEPAQPTRAVASRHFAAAQVSRLTASMRTSSQSIDWDLYKSLNILQARSRAICTNNEYGRKFLQMCATNVVGPRGYNLRIRVKEPTASNPKNIDVTASKAIENAFWDWAKRGNCDVTGKHSFFDICNLHIKGAAREGEVLIKKVYGKTAGTYGFQLQMLDIDRLDVNKNDRKLANGNIIKMGVEVNSYGRPINYHLRIAHPGDNPYYTLDGGMYEVVPASDIYHLFISDRPEQTRGIPWLVAAMLRLNNLGSYEEAAIIAARVGAAKMGFFTTPDGDGTGVSDTTGDDEELITEADPGTFGVLPEGTSFSAFDPDYPHAMYAEFVKAALRGVSSGIGVAYNTLANDLEGVNFSSIRSGVIEERDNWMAIQNWVIESFLDDLFTNWLKFSLISGAIKLPNGAALPAAKFDKFNAAKWSGRRWAWVDPLKDAEASKLLIDNRLRSRQSVIEEMGDDMDDTWEQLAEEQAQMKALGIEPAESDNKNAKPPAAKKEEVN